MSSGVRSKVVKGQRTYRLFAGALAFIWKMLFICKIPDTSAFLNGWVVAAPLAVSFYLRDFISDICRARDKMFGISFPGHTIQFNNLINLFIYSFKMMESGLVRIDG